MRYGQIVMGPAGSGKVSSRFTLLHDILYNNEESAISRNIINLIA